MREDWHTMPTQKDNRQVIHKRAFVGGRAVAWCKAGHTHAPVVTTSPDLAKVNCRTCLGMARQGARGQ